MVSTGRVGTFRGTGDAGQLGHQFAVVGLCRRMAVLIGVLVGCFIGAIIDGERVFNWQWWG